MQNIKIFQKTKKKKSVSIVMYLMNAMKIFLKMKSKGYQNVEEIIINLIKRTAGFLNKAPIFINCLPCNGIANGRFFYDIMKNLLKYLILIHKSVKTHESKM